MAAAFTIGTIAGCGSANKGQEADVNTKEQVTLDNGWPWVNSDLKENIHPDQPKNTAIDKLEFTVL